MMPEKTKRAATAAPASRARPWSCSRALRFGSPLQREERTDLTYSTSSSPTPVMPDIGSTPIQPRPPHTPVPPPPPLEKSRSQVRPLNSHIHSVLVRPVHAWPRPPLARYPPRRRHRCYPPRILHDLLHPFERQPPGADCRISNWCPHRRLFRHSHSKTPRPSPSTVPAVPPAAVLLCCNSAMIDPSVPRPHHSLHPTVHHTPNLPPSSRTHPHFQPAAQSSHWSAYRPPIGRHSHGNGRL